MESSRRTLYIFGGIVTALVVVTTALVLLTKNDHVVLLPENTPEGTVQRYLIALQEDDYRTAYDYLYFEDSMRFVDYEEWASMMAVIRSGPEKRPWKASLGSVTVNDTTALVEVTVDTFRPEGPFSNPVRTQNVLFQLKLIEGRWLITSPIHFYWIF